MPDSGYAWPDYGPVPPKPDLKLYVVGSGKQNPYPSHLAGRQSPIQPRLGMSGGARTVAAWFRSDPRGAGIGRGMALSLELYACSPPDSAAQGGDCGVPVGGPRLGSRSISARRRSSPCSGTSVLAAVRSATWRRQLRVVRPYFPTITRQGKDNFLTGAATTRWLQRSEGRTLIKATLQWRHPHRLSRRSPSLRTLSVLDLPWIWQPN